MKLTHAHLLECLDYNSDTGDLTWKERPENHFKDNRAFKVWNSRFANKEAGTLNKLTGYICISIDYKKYLAHRLAYFHYHGYMPENQIDHKKRVRADNRIDEIRQATQQCNIRNAGMLSNNKTGVKGVCFCKTRKKYKAQIKVNQKQLGLRNHEKFDDAVMARWQAEVKYKFPNCCTDSSAYNYLKENELI